MEAGWGSTAMNTNTPLPTTGTPNVSGRKSELSISSQLCLMSHEELKEELCYTMLELLQSRKIIRKLTEELDQATAWDTKPSAKEMLPELTADQRKIWEFLYDMQDPYCSYTPSQIAEHCEVYLSDVEEFLQSETAKQYNIHHDECGEERHSKYSFYI